MRNIIRGSALALVMGLLWVGGFASAHHDTVTPSVQCDRSQPNTWTIDWSIKNSESDKTQTATSRLGTINIGKGGTGHQTETVHAPADLTLDVHGVWSNGVQNNATGRLSASSFQTDCWPVMPPPGHETRVHATKPTCKNNLVTRTYEARDGIWTWNGETWVETWGDWYVTKVTHYRVKVPNCTIIRHASVRVNIVDKCNCFRDSVKMIHGSHVRVQMTHPTKLTWHFKVTGKKIGRVQYLVRGHGGYAKVQHFTYHTTNVKCPCHKTHTCQHDGVPNPNHCPTKGRLKKPCHI